MGLWSGQDLGPQGSTSPKPLSLGEPWSYPHSPLTHFTAMKTEVQREARFWEVAGHRT